MSSHSSFSLKSISDYESEENDRVDYKPYEERKLPQ
jgi:hypothetical protein